MDISAIKVVKPWYQNDTVFRWLDNKNYEIGVECNKLVENFVSNIVQRKHAEWKQKMQSNNANRTSSGDEDVKYSGMDGGDDAEFDATAMDNMVGKKRIFIEQIFHLEQLGELTLRDIMNESHSMMLVSFETVSNGLMILLMCLAIHLDYQKKLREEINETYPDGNIADITITQLQQLKYLDMVVHESLRLLTTVPMNMRNVSSDFKMHLPAKDNRGAITALVPKNTLVVLDVFNMQRDEAHWGPNAKKFDPEHFAESKSERHPYAFIPFSKGTRSCIGWRYSLLLTKIFLVKLISSFEFQCPGTKLEDLHFTEGISLKFHDSQKIKFQIRKIP
ncbi:probable cytochrome P450 318a1 [Teleopsis dalmanni]|uniref:probable cytochrome P450 318a1 n=1 Tax=Teleopsis dalmanni TaxID=139649 RepID=UPI0018CDC122|nr:probable cytochrome P450 318a1 [Teleopsis dalmanni]